MQLDERLRRHVDDLAAPVSIDSIFERAEISAGAVEPASRRRTVVLTLAAAVIVVALALIVRQGGSSIVATEPHSSIVPSLPTFPASPALWQEIESPFPPQTPGNAVVVNAAIEFGGAGWAVGSEWTVVAGAGTLDVRKRGAIWRSDDGETWTVVDGTFGSLDTPSGNWVPSGIALEHIVSTRGTLFAFGNEYRNSVVPVAYQSRNGSSWESIDLPFTPDQQTQLIAVDVHQDRIAALVVDDGTTSREQTRLLLSDDGGNSWHVDAVELEPRAEVVDVSLFADRIVLVGTVTSPQPDEGSAGAVWFSDDVATWKRATTPTDGPSSLSFVENGPNGLVTSGRLGDADQQTVDEARVIDGSSALLWQSDDGATWSTLDLTAPADPREVEPFLVAHDLGVLALTPWRSGSNSGVEAISSTSSGTESLGQLPAARATTVLVIDGRLVLIGSANSAATVNVEHDYTVWVSPLDD